jgi:hypothetical protein
MRARSIGALAALIAATALAALQAGCLVQSRCNSSADCLGNETCSSTGACELECTEDMDCLTRGMLCVDSRCQLPPSRIKAQNFCLKVENPKATAYYNKQLCLEQLKGKVVLIFFGATLG